MQRRSSDRFSAYFRGFLFVFHARDRDNRIYMAASAHGRGARNSARGCRRASGFDALPEGRIKERTVRGFLPFFALAFGSSASAISCAIHRERRTTRPFKEGCARARARGVLLRIRRRRVLRARETAGSDNAARGGP